MDRKLRDHWSDLIRPLFKPNADLRISDNEDHYDVVVSWRLGTDPSRSSKRSKRIRIMITWEAVDDYQNKSELKRKHDDDKLIQFIKANIENFEPNHDNLIEIGPPEVKWIADSGLMNS